MPNSLYTALQTLENPNHPLTPPERLKAINGPLLHWYKSHARILPWRENPESYRVWISEIMLQQTRVEAVKPYFQRFIKALPTVSDLACIEEERLLKLWEGLGYYNRARNLQKTARIVMEEYNGQLPSSYEQLLTLPGIGSYTAGAIASIAYGIPVPAVDGNVLRVLSRVLASYEDILKQSTKRNMEQLLLQTMPRKDVSSFNQGLIEIGAVICVPNGQPRCEQCPLGSVCLARKQSITGEIPVKTPKRPRRIEEKTVLVLKYKNQIALHKRDEKGLLAGLYELPNTDGHLSCSEAMAAMGIRLDQVESSDRLPPAKHIFSHVEWHMTGYCIEMKEPDEGHLFVEIQQLRDEYPLPNAFAAYRRLL